MNPSLQNILKLAEESGNLSDEQKKQIATWIKEADKQLTITEFKLDRTEKVKKTTAILLEETIEELEQKRKAVEEHNKELAIEGSLERVRARTMAMQKSDELSETAVLLFHQLMSLEVNVKGCGFNIWEKDEKSCTSWMSGPDGELSPPFKLPLTGDPLFIRYYESRQNGEDFFVYETGKEELTKRYKFLSTLPVLGDAITKELKEGKEMPPFLVDHVVNFSQGNLIFITYEPCPNAHDIFKRFGKVFEQTYTRFLDLQKAEAQAKESQIQLALERVRARTMAMQHSDELLNAATLLFQQIESLGASAWNCSFNIWTEDKKFAIAWNGTKEGFGRPFHSNSSEDVFLEFYNASQRGDELFVKEIGGKELELHYDYLSTVPGVGETLAELKAAGVVLPTFQIFNIAYFAHGYLMFITYQRVPEFADIFKRFAKVFEQTYTRFLDLQKAEAQTREAQIEAALERVRAKAMAMHKSEDLHEAVAVVFEELDKLNLGVLRVGISVLNKETRTGDVWLTSIDKDKSVQVYGNESFDFHPLMQGSMDAWIRQEDFYYILEGADLTSYYKGVEAAQFGLPASQLLSSGDEYKKQSCYVAVYNSGGLFAFREGEFPQEAKAVMKRFANVFDLTYKRFLDLQKAEAQARESQIQLALERVRARTMAMQHSNELADASFVLDTQVRALGIKTRGCAFNIYGDNESFEWFSSEQGSLPMYKLPRENLFLRYFQKGLTGTPLYIEEFAGKVCADHYEYLCTIPIMGDALRAMIAAGGSFPTRQIDHVTYFKYGYLLFLTLEPEPEAHDIFIRFAKVFEQTYTRFLDLKKAEAQAKESQIESALERVRSRTMAMQKSDELAETAAVLFQQLIALGIEPNRLYISIIKGEEGETEFWITDEDGTKVSTAFASNMNDNSTFLKMYEGWKQQRKSLVIDMQGEELQSYFAHLNSLGVPFKGGLEQKRRVQDIAYFSKGFIGMASTEEQPAETLQLLERFAAVFNLTFTRFNDLKIAEAHAEQSELDLIAIKEAKQKAEAALTELQATQKQLVQSEKMASLGELTAGIAHEIQNPLNFVNNFSEVSAELIEEMNQELIKGDIEEAKFIAEDIRQNLEKITHHGKRADAIVKGMLQHSQKSSGEKIPSDINALGDEYLRLAYHGLRAKDKLFNATLHTDFDKNIGTINIIPQDIGRVILNIVTNAFYAVNEKKKQGEKTYQPTVSIVSRKLTDTIEVLISDNGNGIPKNIVDKIFQPFFTTKPTGQGTGLGLSLAYDIVKAHGGELNVDSNEQGTSFIISLPNSLNN